MPEWAETASALAGRLIRADIRDPRERAVQLRLVAGVLGAPVFAGLVFGLAGGPFMGLSTIIGVCLVIFAAALALLAAMAVTGSSVVAAFTGLLGAGALVAVMVSMTGGVTGPLAILLAAPAFEAWWAMRTRSAFVTGIAVSAGATFLQFGLASGISGTGGELSPWLAVAPVVWLASVAIRFSVAQRVFDNSRRQAKEADVLSELQDVVLLQIAKNGDIERVSPKARDMLGIHPGLLLGTGLFDRIHVADRIAFLTAIADMRDGEMRRTAEVRLRLPDQGGASADHCFLPFSVDFARDTNGGFAGFLRDNSTVAALRDELAAISDEAESADIAKSRFLASVSHELRTPLNAIIGFADILHQEMFGGFENPRQKEYVGLISHSGHHLLSVVNAILDVSKIESGTYTIRPEAFDFAESAAMPLSIAAQQSGDKSITLEKRFGDGLDNVLADRRAVQQMLINLLSNAVKFTPDGGTVTLGSRMSNGRFTFWVNDTGIGIAEGDLKRLGQPFMQVQNDYTRNYEGTGLGLSLVKGLVKLHGGTMAIDSAPGEGTCVTISLPVPISSPNAATLVELKTRDQNGMDHATLRKTA